MASKRLAAVLNDILEREFPVKASYGSKGFHNFQNLFRFSIFSKFFCNVPILRPEFFSSTFVII